MKACARKREERFTGGCRYAVILSFETDDHVYYQVNVTADGKTMDEARVEAVSNALDALRTLTQEVEEMLK